MIDFYLPNDEALKTFKEAQQQETRKFYKDLFILFKIWEADNQ